MNVSSLVNKPSYTDNGNRYSKFSGGKKIGAVALPAIMFTKDVFAGAFKKENVEFVSNSLGGKGKYFGLYALGTAMFVALGTGFGAIVDAAVNKTRRSKADQAAAQNEQIAQNNQNTEE